MLRIWPGILVLLVLTLGCSKKEPQLLDVAEVYGRTVAELTARFGEPDVLIPKSGDRTTVQWKSLLGTWVYVAAREDTARYITYNFKGMEPFDPEEAFRRIGMEPPDEEPEHEWDNGAKRWLPFREYDKLTINPQIKAITVGDRWPHGSETASAEE